MAPLLFLVEELDSGTEGLSSCVWDVAVGVGGGSLMFPRTMSWCASSRDNVGLGLLKHSMLLNPGILARLAGAARIP